MLEIKKIGHMDIVTFKYAHTSIYGLHCESQFMRILCHAKQIYNLDDLS